MLELSPVVARLLSRLRDRRVAAGIDVDELSRELILGPGWVERFESGATIPDLETFVALMDNVGAKPGDIFENISEAEPERENVMIRRKVYALPADDGIELHFDYGKFDAMHRIEGATLDEFDEVLLALRNGLARSVDASDDSSAIKSGAVSDAFIKAVELWPNESPSDIWWFVVYRAFLDPYNHPAADARLAFEQSWKRTGGWALEEIFARHYNVALNEHDIHMEIATGARREELIDQLVVASRIESDKADVLLVGPDDRCFGIVHVKASFAERRTDDVPMSQALVSAGYCSPLLTMDCKSTPSARPINKGELGKLEGKRSAKRKDIEDDGYFSACFSYNSRTQPTPARANAKARIHVCDFSDPNDEFTKFIIGAWKEFSAS